MELLLFVLIAGVAGYLISRSRLSKPIDQSAQKVAETTQKAAKTTGGWASRTGSWISNTINPGKKPKDEVVDVTEVKSEPAATEPVVAEKAATEPAPAAVKQQSRRKNEEEKSE
jgi:hypothetical protein